jgi:hypothetical protein
VGKSSLVRKVLASPERDVAQWTEKLLRELNGEDKIILDLVPLLRLVIGEVVLPDVLPFPLAKRR